MICAQGLRELAQRLNRQLAEATENHRTHQRELCEAKVARSGEGVLLVPGIDGVFVAPEFRCSSCTGSSDEGRALGGQIERPALQGAFLPTTRRGTRIRYPAVAFGNP